MAAGARIWEVSAYVPYALESKTMTWLSRTSALVLLVAPALVSASFAQAVDVWTVGVNNTRQGWNKFETVLTPANVPRLKKIREFIVDEKIDVSPLVVGDKLYVFTMTNTAYVFDVNTGAQLVKTPARRAVRPGRHRQPPGKGMDLHNIYRNWGITATPVIDVATNTIYVTTFGKPNAASQNTERNNMLWILDAEHARRQEATSAYCGQCRQRRRRDRERLHHAVPEDARGPGTVDRRRWKQGRGGLVLHQWREPERSGTRIRRRVRRARPQSRGRFHADAGDLERHPGRRRWRGVDVGLRACDRR